MRQHPISVVIIDDDQVLCYLLNKALQPPEFIVAVAYDGITGAELVSQLDPQVILLDIDVPGMNGFAVLAELKDMDLQAKCITTSARPTLQWRYEAREAGSDAMLPKPFSRDELIGVIAHELCVGTRHG